MHQLQPVWHKTTKLHQEPGYGNTRERYWPEISTGLLNERE